MSLTTAESSQIQHLPRELGYSFNSTREFYVASNGTGDPERPRRDWFDSNM